MSVIATSVAVLMALGYFLPSQAGGVQPVQISMKDPATFRFIREANIFTDRSETYLYITASQAVKDDVLSELMEKLEANPRMELDSFESFLLLTNGESVRISRTWPDGRELTLEELMALFDYMSIANHGKFISPVEVLEQNMVTVKRYWSPKHSPKKPAQ